MAITKLGQGVTFNYPEGNLSDEEITRLLGYLSPRFVKTRKDGFTDEDVLESLQSGMEKPPYAITKGGIGAMSAMGAMGGAGIGGIISAPKGLAVGGGLGLGALLALGLYGRKKETERQQASLPGAKEIMARVGEDPEKLQQLTGWLNLPGDERFK